MLGEPNQASNPKNRANIRKLRGGGGDFRTDLGQSL